MAFRIPSDPSTRLAGRWRHHRAPERLTSLFRFEGARPHAGQQVRLSAGVSVFTLVREAHRPRLRDGPGVSWSAHPSASSLELRSVATPGGSGPPRSPLRTAERARASFQYFLRKRTKNESQATKSQRWMPWRQMPMKDVDGCDKPRGAAYLASIRGSPNGETRQGSCLVTSA